MSGHTISISTDLLKCRIVETLHFHQLSSVEYTRIMTEYCNDYKSRTGVACNTVSTIEPLEKWYFALSDEQKENIKQEYSIVKL